ncbi:hypothetical protein [Actinoplanes friuliensis]|uniref:Lipoprotein n=1 Tax=Actinoplanes friuliensis DSM 7358 TaxID=1246995 RepID=U5WE51_9ACTN|nr:hypothetical protein [Actinoplanes friuliensis]AGZ46305.1 hypothetical protein AFR_40255 [Actinoplanes friuliensis DSM 7358]
MLRSRWFALGLAVLMTGCSDAGPPEAGIPSPSASARPSAAELCAYLESRLPRLQELDSKASAQGNLTGGLYGWYEQRGAAPDPAELDRLTRSACPGVRDQVLEATGMSSFTG